MTKKHFITLAAALLSIRPDESERAERSAWFAAVAVVADTCASANPRFDRQRFYSAAGA